MLILSGNGPNDSQGDPPTGAPLTSDAGIRRASPQIKCLVVVTGSIVFLHWALAGFTRETFSGYVVNDGAGVGTDESKCR